MHSTDTLLSLSHARIARAAAAGPRRATQPTALTDRQHLARIAQDGPGRVTIRLLKCADFNRWLIEHLGELSRADDALAHSIDEI